MTINDSILEAELLQYLEKNPSATTDDIKKRFFRVKDEVLNARLDALKTRNDIQDDGSGRLTKRTR